MTSFFVKKIYLLETSPNFSRYVLYSTVFIVGMWLNFLDLFLTSAFLTIMIVAFPTFLQKFKRKLPFWENVRFIFFFLISIQGGYIFGWIMKWVLTFIFGDKTAILFSVKSTIIKRASKNSFIEGVDADWFNVVASTFKFLQSKPLDGNFFLLLIALNLLFIIFFVLTKPMEFFNQSPFYFFTLIPFFFFYLLANWSSIHTFISYRAIVFSLIFVSALNLLQYKAQKPRFYRKLDKNSPKN